MELMDLANQMSQEEQRYVREGLQVMKNFLSMTMLFRDDLIKRTSRNLKKLQQHYYRK